MADRFYKDIELPDLTGVTPPAPDSGFIQVYGKGGKLAYQAADGIEVIVVDKGDKGDTGDQGIQGVAGDNGWSPQFAIVIDGERRVLQVVDWTDGQGVKPATGLYVGAAGLVSNIANGIDIRGQQGAAGISPTATNSFATINANGTLVVSDSPTDTLLLNQGSGISITANNTSDSGKSITIKNNDTGSSAVSHHLSARDPHPQYLIKSQAPSFQHAVLTTTQTNTTTTEATLTGHTFTIPPGKVARIDGILVFTGASTIRGAFYGVQVTQGAGANGNAVGSWYAYVNVSSAAAATGLSDGDVFNLAGGESTPTGAGVVGTNTTSGNNSARLSCIVKNNSTNADTTVNITFRSEVAGSAVTAQIGTSASCIIS